MTGKLIIFSTGMSAMDQIDAAVDIFDPSKVIFIHATSTMPPGLSP